MVYGYIRVSSKDQNTARQLDELSGYGIDKKRLYIDKQSGKDFDRPQYKRMVRRLKKDDLLVVKSIDRLGRSYKDIVDQWQYIVKDKGVDIKVIDMPLLDTTQSKDLMGTFISDLVLQLLSYVAENERTSIRQRQKEGIASAKRRGVVFGRPRRPLPDDFYFCYEEWKRGNMTLRDGADICEMPLTTYYQRIKEAQIEEELEFQFEEELQAHFGEKNNFTSGEFLFY